MTSLGAVLIVRNEAGRIEACLASAIAAGVTVVTVVDTGSTDDTRERVTDACRGIELRRHRRPFVNFGQARSEAFALARGSADWLLALDADMTVEIAQGFQPDPELDAYMIEMHTEGLDYRLPLLLRGDLPWLSVGAVHEYTALATGGVGRRMPTDAVRVSYVHDPGSPEKARFYARLLEDEHAEQPDNPRTVYYLAQAYRGLGDPRAKGLYERRASMDGGEEAALAAYWAACLEPDWPAQALALLRAWEMRPQRLEPLYDLVHGLNERGQHLTAYRLATTLVGPCDDALPRWPGVYDWGMDFERSIAAWHVGEWAEAAALNESLLANPRLPESVREAVQRNATLIAVLA